MRITIFLFTILILNACQTPSDTTEEIIEISLSDTLKPVFVTDTTAYDTDDPAIWINTKNPSQSLIIGTDKNKNGGLYVYDLNGQIIKEKVVKNLQRPNNVDIEYGLMLNGKLTDIAVTTERLTHKLRIFSLPDMQPIDNGGIEVFKDEEGEEFRALMGIALYKRPEDNAIFAIVGRKSGPADGYLWQYLLEDDETGNVKATLVRKFGAYSGKNEIEAIAIDDKLGFVYYSDEGVGVRKYFADPAMSNQEIDLFAVNNFVEDHEGISIYESTDSTGYILVSDQQANQFHIYPREGKKQELIAEINFSTNESDGNEVTSIPLNDTFRKGLFVAMSDDKTFHYYKWEDIEAMIKLARKE